MTEKGSILNFGHRIDCNGVGVLRGLRHIPSNNYPKYPPWPHILREWYKTTMLERKAHTGTEQTKISHHLKLHFPFVCLLPSAPLGNSLASQGRTQESLCSSAWWFCTTWMTYKQVSTYDIKLFELTDGAVMARLASVTEATPVNPFWRGAVWFCRLDSEVLASPMV